VRHSKASVEILTRDGSADEDDEAGDEAHAALTNNTAESQGNEQSGLTGDETLSEPMMDAFTDPFEKFFPPAAREGDSHAEGESYHRMVPSVK
jgi:hypothetical protein